MRPSFRFAGDTKHVAISGKPAVAGP